MSIEFVLFVVDLREVVMKPRNYLYPLFLVATGASAQSTVGVLGTPRMGALFLGLASFLATTARRRTSTYSLMVFRSAKREPEQVLGTLGMRTHRYGVLVPLHFSNLANGPHTITVTADGVPFATNTFTTVKVGGEQFHEASNT